MIFSPFPLPCYRLELLCLPFAFPSLSPYLVLIISLCLSVGDLLIIFLLNFRFFFHVPLSCLIVSLLLLSFLVSNSCNLSLSSLTWSFRTPFFGWVISRHFYHIFLVSYRYSLFMLYIAGLCSLSHHFHTISRFLFCRLPCLLVCLTSFSFLSPLFLRFSVASFPFLILFSYHISLDLD